MKEPLLINSPSGIYLSTARSLDDAVEAIAAGHNLTATHSPFDY